MKLLAVAVLLILTAYASYWQGHRVGVQECPEMAKVQDTHNRELEAYFEKELSEPIGRELICDQVFDLVRDELVREELIR